LSFFEKEALFPCFVFIFLLLGGMTVCAFATHIASLPMALARLAATVRAGVAFARVLATGGMVAARTRTEAATAAGAFARTLSTSTRHDFGLFIVSLQKPKVGFEGGGSAGCEK
jgi:hypothetical protein